MAEYRIQHDASDDEDEARQQARRRVAKRQKRLDRLRKQQQEPKEEPLVVAKTERPPRVQEQKKAKSASNNQVSWLVSFFSLVFFPQLAPTPVVQIVVGECNPWLATALLAELAGLDGRTRQRLEEHAQELRQLDRAACNGGLLREFDDTSKLVDYVQLKLEECAAKWALDEGPTAYGSLFMATVICARAAPVALVKVEDGKAKDEDKDKDLHVQRVVSLFRACVERLSEMRKHPWCANTSCIYEGVLGAVQSATFAASCTARTLNGHAASLYPADNDANSLLGKHRRHLESLRKR